MNSIEDLKPEELEYVKLHLNGLINSLKKRKPVAGSGGLLSEEEHIFNSLLHPERGDVTVFIDRTTKPVGIYISNPREPDNPYSVMSYKESNRNTNRRSLSGLSGYRLEDGDYGLFLINAQDRDILDSERDNIISMYSTNFEVSESRPVSTNTEIDTLKNKPIEACTASDKWIIFEKNWEFDNRLDQIEKDLFQIEISYAKYKMPVKQEKIFITPGHYKEHIGQMIRDIYPPNVETVLIKDFPTDHRKKVHERKDIMNTLKFKLEEKISAVSGAHPDYLEFLESVKAYISNQILLLK